ncbi:hypothetical protein ACWDWO_25280 [Actinopolymorpha singaporensis]|uniref:Uncharacterized protein n=1 Tax=Actinopolymorpha singaporensis TaxID=117157 RepID=A0A1H1PM03_9ACTN|nr:hypothetical protein [Actinopolymorpha singaporensis]SDS12311.1 hypothetical protein SAMN04489717_1695 [Actinopolymorpha singaporensis]
MAVAALITWVITAILGATMLRKWVSGGGLAAARADAAGTAEAATSPQAAATSFPPGVVFGHFLVVLAGLVLWIIYIVVDNDVLTWVSFAALIVGAVLGDVMFLRWRKSRSGPESQLPRELVYVHGGFAVVTIVLVLLTALGVGS